MAATGHGLAMALMRKFYGLAMAQPWLPLSHGSAMTI